MAHLDVILENAATNPTNDISIFLNYLNVFLILHVLKKSI